MSYRHELEMIAVAVTFAVAYSAVVLAMAWIIGLTFPIDDKPAMACQGIPSAPHVYVCCTAKACTVTKG